MLKQKLIQFSWVLAFIVSGCSLPIAFDPLSYAPKSPNCTWVPYQSTSSVMTSQYCSPIVPSDFEKKTLTLAELIDIALVNNPITKKSWAEAKAAAAAYGKSLSDYFPDIEVIGTAQRQRITFFNAITPGQKTSLDQYYQTVATPEISLTYTLFDFGQRKYSSELARQTLLYADWSHNRELQTIIQIVMNDYYNYQSSKEKYKAMEEDLIDAETSLDAALQKFQMGIAAVGDVVQAKTNYLQTKMQLISQQDTVETLIATLINALGLPANLPLKTQDFPKQVYVSDMMGNVDVLIAKAQKYRQDYFAAHAQVKANRANVYYAKSQGMPVLNTELDIGKNFYNAGLTEDYHFSAILKLSFPLFKGFFYKNQERQAMAKLRRAKALLEQTELAIAKDVTIANYHVKNAADTLTYSKEYLLAAQERFSIALSNYKVGTATILDVLSAQSSLADARAKDVQSKKNWFVSLANLAYATGTLGFKEDDRKI